MKPEKMTSSFIVARPKETMSTANWDRSYRRKVVKVNSLCQDLNMRKVGGFRLENTNYHDYLVNLVSGSTC